MSNFQNFYESFCRSTFSEDTEDLESTGFDSFDVDDQVVDLSYLDEELVDGHFPVDLIFPHEMDPFLSKIMEFGDCPLSLSVASGVEYLRKEDCLLAMQNIKAASAARGFMLPGRRAELLCENDFIDSGLSSSSKNQERNYVVMLLGTI